MQVRWLICIASPVSSAATQDIPVLAFKTSSVVANILFMISGVVFAEFRNRKSK